MLGLKLTSAKELTGELKMSLPQVYGFLQKLPQGIVVRLGRRVRINKDRLEEWMLAGGHATQQRERGL